MKLLKLNLIYIINCTTSKNVLKFGLLFLKKLNTLKTRVQQERTARFLLVGACDS